MFVGFIAYVLYMYTFEFDLYFVVISYLLINIFFYRAYSLIFIYIAFF